MSLFQFHIYNFMQQLFQFKQNRGRHLLSGVIFILSVSFLLTSCAKLPVITLVSKSTETTQNLPTPRVVTEMPTVTLLPTAAIPTVILVAPATGDQSLVGVFKADLTKKTAGIGWSFKSQTSLTATDLQPGVKVVMALPPDPGLAAMAPAHPLTQFVAVGITGLQPSSNLSLVGSEGFRSDQAAFLAGYLSAMVTPDWRVGVINPGDTDNGALIRDAFKNGARYFCGLCRPAYPPYVVFPQSSALAIASDSSGWQSAADALLSSSVQTIYVPSESSSPELLDYLDKAKVNIVSGPLPTGTKYAYWLASISSDPAAVFDQIWPDLIAGKGGASLPLPLVITNINASLVSEGRMRLVQGVMDELANDQINPDLVPDQ